MTLHDEIAAIRHPAYEVLTNAVRPSEVQCYGHGWADGVTAALAIVDAHRCGPTEAELAAALSPWAIGQLSDVYLTPEQLDLTSRRTVKWILDVLHPEVTQAVLAALAEPKP